MNSHRELLDTPPNEIPIRGHLHRPTGAGGSDCLVLTHGAGANCDSPFLVALADAFCASGVTVLRFDLPFRQLRPHGPPPRSSAERDQQGLRAAVASMRRQTSGWSIWAIVPDSVIMLCLDPDFVRAHETTTRTARVARRYPLAK